MAENDDRTSSSHIAVGAPPHTATANNSVPKTDPARARAPKKATTTANAEPKDSLREVVETIVFVVVLVLLLKSFVAEAFVIPTGSMAETLYGYQKLVTCPKCGFNFPVNCSSEVDPQQGELPTPVVGCACPNCFFHIDFKDYGDRGKWPSWNTGDRVLVGKYFYDLDVRNLNGPGRYQVVVFKYPERPQRDYTPLNYIKRLIGLSGETIAIHYGKLYHYLSLNYDDRDVPKKDLWEARYMHKDDEAAMRSFTEGKFEILRKPAKQVLAERRIVFDNDHQPSDLKGKNRLGPRWQVPENKSAWVPDDREEPKVFRHAAGQEGEIAWLRYQHLVPAGGNRNEGRRELITDFMGYNTYVKEGNDPRILGFNWVGDLMLECEVDVQQKQGRLVFELSKGIDRFQARFDLTSGRCALFRMTTDGEQELDSKPTTITKTGNYRIRFANVDERLLVWVDSRLPFGEGVNYPEPRQQGPWAENDFEPASIGAKDGAVVVSHLKLWRDTYYTANVERQPADHGNEPVDFSDPRSWEPLRKLPVRTMYVQPEHFLCLGDNSPESSDGRSWGAVPKRLMLGRALSIYWPYYRVRLIE